MEISNYLYPSKTVSVYFKSTVRIGTILYSSSPVENEALFDIRLIKYCPTYIINMCIIHPNVLQTSIKNKTGLVTNNS